MSKGDRLMEAAEEAIDEVFSDRSVSQRETIARLNNLMACIEIKIAAIKSDLKREEQEPKKQKPISQRSHSKLK